jgi:hypothetical protein
MQSPVILFDHVRREVLTLDSRTETRLADMIESQRRQVATSGRPAK